VYKTLGVKWLFERSAPHRRLCRRIGTKPAIPNVSYTQPLAASLRNETMTKQIFFSLILNLIILSTLSSQTMDTIHFEGFKGIICDSLTTPFGSRNIFPKNRFNPTIEEVKQAEEQILIQFGNATKKHHNLFFEEYKPDDFENLNRKERKEYKWLINYKRQAKKALKEANIQIQREYRDYHRKYYGYIGINEMRYIRIEFQPHKEKWVEIFGTGESHLYNLPILVYNLNNKTLSWAGWTGENDE
jgi:hypothetical protein